jgi:hypothetical protein
MNRSKHFPYLIFSTCYCQRNDLTSVLRSIINIKKVVLKLKKKTKLRDF